MGGRVLVALFLLGIPAAACGQTEGWLPARIVVECPADVVLVIGGQRMQSMGVERWFETPPMPMGQIFMYEVGVFREELMVAARTVEVEAGRTSRLVVALDEDRPEGKPSVPPGPRLIPARNFGIDLKRLREPSVEQRAELNGVPIAWEEVKEVLRGDDRLPDPGRRRLTIIGGPEQRQSAKQLLEGELKAAAAGYVIQDYSPDHWAVARCGFVTSGQPTIYAQEADGKVLFRQDDLRDLRMNLEAVRKPSPDYRPEHDPDYRRSGVPWKSLRDWLPGVSVAVAGWFLWKSIGPWPGRRYDPTQPPLSKGRSILW